MFSSLIHKEKSEGGAYFCIFTEVKHIPSAGLLFPEIKRQADIGFHKRSVHPFEDGCDESLGI